MTTTEKAWPKRTMPSINSNYTLNY